MAPYPASASASSASVAPRSASPSSAPFLPVLSLDQRRTVPGPSTYLPYHNQTARSEHGLNSRSEHNLTTRSNFNLAAARPDYNLTTRAGYYNLTTREYYNLTTRHDNNVTVRTASETLTTIFPNITTWSTDSNLTVRSAYNLTTRSDDINVTGRFDQNLTTRVEAYNSSSLSPAKMIIRTASYNWTAAEDGSSQKDGQAAHRIVTRAATRLPCQGCTDPSKINNNAFFALFAILGVVIVVGTIWFFFHAKNGGFVWQENDWDDYKSTVLRRKGPDGKTLSNATKSTRLGGGSIVAHHDKLAAMTVIGYDEKGRKGIRAKRGFGGTHSIYYGDDFSQYSGSRADQMSEVRTINDYHRPRQNRGGAASNESPGADKPHSRRYRDRDVRDYRHEKPARVGGMNRPADGSAYTYSEDSATVITESTNRSSANLIRPDHETHGPRHEEKKHAKAERKAHEEAARMERKWRKDAEAAARAIARENEPSPIPPQHAHRPRRDSRSASPKKRDYSFSKGADEVISTAYTASSSGDRSHSASYYDAYRPKNERAASKSRGGSPTKAGYRRHAESEAETSDSGTRVYQHNRRGSAAVKEKKPARGGRDVMAGYRRGMDEDDF